MPTLKCTHEENRSKVCAACGKKISLGTKKIDYFRINEQHIELIKLYLCENFDITKSKFPLSICDTCRRSLNDRKKNVSKRPLPVMPNYQDIILPKNTRAHQDICNCYICLTGRYNAHEKIVKGRGIVRNFNFLIFITGFLVHLLT